MYDEDDDWGLTCPDCGHSGGDFDVEDASVLGGESDRVRCPYCGWIGHVEDAS